MANKIILPTYKMAAATFISTLKKKSVKRKLIFQCKLKSISRNNATFGLTCYEMTKLNRRWKTGKKLFMEIDTTKPESNFAPPLIFGNNELVPGIGGKKHPGSIYKKLRALAASKKSVKGIDLIFTPKKTKNPHVYYDVIIGTTSELTNPSPPANPS